MNYQKLLGISSVVLLWQIIAVLPIVDPFFFPGPLTVVTAFITLLPSGLFQDISATFFRVGESFLISTIIAIPLGLLLGHYAAIYRSIEPIIDFLRSLPATAVFPVFMLFFGIGNLSKIAVAVFGAFLIIMFNTAFGVVHSKQLRTLAARLMGASSWKIFRSITFWEGLPYIFVGLRNSVSLTLILIIFTEMFVGSTAGIGRRIVDSQVSFKIPEMYAALLAAGLLGYILNHVLILIEKRLIHWSGSA